MADSASATARPGPSALDRRATEHIGQLLGPWELVRLVGDGDLSRVYEARPADSPADRSAAYIVKHLQPRWQSHPAAVAMFQYEAQAGHAVRHPHLVSVLAAQLGEPPYYLVMPRLKGVDLAGRLARGWRPGLGVALWIARQVAEALDALDRAGWMHGDVKPANILIGPDGHVTLLDLGFARPLGRPESAVGRCVLGTPHYIAPEMVTSALRGDGRSDIYSLGAVLYEMLAGAPPYDAPRLEDLVRQHREAAPQPLRRRAPHVPLDVARLVHAMIAKQPLRRPQTPAELVDRLVRLEIASLAQR